MPRAREPPTRSPGDITHRSRQLPADLLIGDPGPMDMFDDRVYKRGALTLHALRLSIGDDEFFELLRAWTDENRHGTVTTADFIDLVAARTGRDLGEFFEAWLYHPALPALPALPVLPVLPVAAAAINPERQRRR